MTENLPDSFILRSVNVLDETGAFSGPVDVTVSGGRITDLGTNSSVGPDTVSYDLADCFLMPGVFDCHVHIAISSVDALELLRTPVTQWALEAGSNARRTLEGGVTFVRDAAGAEAGIRTAIERELIAGPRLQLSIMIISETGGHADGFLAGPGLEAVSGYMIPDYPGRPPHLANGPDEMRDVVRALLRAGADWIKLCTTGGVMSPTDHPERPEFTREEIEVAVEEAARKKKAVMVHAMGGSGIDDAVAAGVRSVEHGMFLTEEQAKAMAERGCWLVPTLSIAHDVIRLAEDDKLPSYATAKAIELKPIVGTAVAIAREAGVPIATGTDFFTRGQHGQNLRELAHLVDAGMTPAEVLLAATQGGAELCGVAEEYGRLSPGYVFDAILLDEDPSDCSLFGEPEGKVAGVFKGGKPIVPHPRLEGA